MSQSGSGARRRSVVPAGAPTSSPVVKSSYGAPPDSAPSRRSPTRHLSPTRSNASARSAGSRPGPPSSNGRRGAAPGRVVDSDDDEMDSDASYDDDGAESAEVRYARLKQRNQNTIGRNRVNGTSLNNTSVNIATAFNQAAGSTLSLRPSSSSESERNPRKESHTPLPSGPSSQRRNLAMPPPPRNNGYSNHIDQRGTPDRRERAKSPVLDAIAGAARALSPVSYLLKPRVGMMNDQFPEDREEEEDDGPSYRSFGAAMTSPNKSRAAELPQPHHDASFLSATTANGSEDASRSYGGPSAESSYQFDEEERLMQEIEEERLRDKGKGKAVASGSGTGAGWLGSLPGFSRASPAPSTGTNGASIKKKPVAKDASYRPQATSQNGDSSSGSGSEDSDESDVGLEGDKVTKSTLKRRPRISHDNASFKYKPGQSGSDESESDGDGGRRKRRRRKSGKIGPLGAEGMTPVMQGKKRKGRKGKRSAGKNGEISEDDEPDVSLDIPALPKGHHEPQDDVSYDDDPTMEFGNDDSREGQEEDDSFVVQMSKAAARGPAATSNSQLPTHFKSKPNSPLVVAQNLGISAVRNALIGFIHTWNAIAAVLSWMLKSLQQSVSSLDWGLASKAIAAAVILGTLAILLDQPSVPAEGAVRPPSKSTSWLPSVHFDRPKHGASAYRTPDLPPESMDELVERLAQLETALGSLTDQARRSDAHRSQVETHVVQLQDRLSSDIKKVSSEVEKRDQAERERIANLDKVVGKIRGDVDVLSGRVKKMGEQVDSDAKEIERLDDGAEVVRKELKSLSDRVREAEKVAREAADATRVARIATEAIESYLPSKLVVRMNPKTNTLDIDPSFWKAMRDVFVEHGKVEPVVASRIDKLEASLQSSVASLAKSSKSSTAPPMPPPVASVAVPQVPSWMEFLSTNEHALRAWSDAEHDRKSSDGAVVSRKTFLEVLHRELETLKVDLEKQAAQNLRSVSDEILAKSVAAGKVAAQQAVPAPSSDKTKKDTIVKTASGQNISDLITTMIDAALLKYSKDILAKTDYALYTAGGRVIPSITSDTYSVKQPSTGWFGGKKPIEGRPPVTALLAEIGNGECWPVEGSQGQLAVLLAKPVLVTEITIEHAAREVSFNMDAAPREIEVWGLVDGATAQAKVADYQASHPTEDVSSLPPSPNYILLASFAYDIDSPNHIQTFPVSDAVRELGLETGIVVVRIRSNYGAGYTCLYRVRVHGDDLQASAVFDPSA